MTCRGCGHIYPISNGIPNMVSQVPADSHVGMPADVLLQLLAEHEVGR
jgi:hypothetical protein